MKQDRRLIWRLRRGDPAALRCIYEQYKGDLLTIAVSMLVDVAAAEDVLHDVFVALAAGVPVSTNIRGYLVTCIANRARDHLRKNARRNPLHAASLEGAPEVVSAATDPPRQLIAREEAQAVYQALKKLPYEQREVITLHLHGSMTFKQIASQLDVSINTVQSRYRYGLDRLRSLLDAGVRS